MSTTTLADTLGALSSAAAAAATAIPDGTGHDVAAIAQAALGVSATLARAGIDRAGIVAIIHRAPDIAARVAAQDAAIDAVVAGLPSATPTSDR